MKNSSFVFEGQRPDEEVVLMLRQHPWVMSSTGFIVLLIIFICALPLILPGGFIGLKLLAIGCAVGAVLAGLRLFIWWNTVYVVSDQRIIGIDQQKVLMRKVNEVPLENIQNITHVKKGVGAMTFDYGTVLIQTSGGKTAARLRNVEHPLEVQQKVLDANRHISRKDK